MSTFIDEAKKQIGLPDNYASGNIDLPVTLNLSMTDDNIIINSVKAAPAKVPGDGTGQGVDAAWVIGRAGQVAA